MEYRPLGKSGMMVSTIGLGTNNFGGRADEQSSLRVLDQALDLGINFIDTANIYAGAKSEEIIGKGLKGKRDKVIIGTKFGMTMGKEPNMIGGSRRHMMEMVEGSLKRLQTDYIDLYTLHAPDKNTPIEETLRAFDDLIRQGKVRSIGSSNFAAWQVVEAAWVAKSLNVNGFVCEQPYYNVLKRGIEKELIPACRKYDVSVVPYFPLESGMLTGKYRKGEDPPEGARLSKMPPAAQARTFTDRNFEIVEKLESFARERDRTVGDLAHARLLANEAVASVISGATKAEQVVENARASDWTLTADEINAIDEIAPAA